MLGLVVSSIGEQALAMLQAKEVEKLAASVVVVANTRLPDFA